MVGVAQTKVILPGLQTTKLVKPVFGACPSLRPGNLNSWYFAAQWISERLSCADDDDEDNRKSRHGGPILQCFSKYSKT